MTGRCSLVAAPRTRPEALAADAVRPSVPFASRTNDPDHVDPKTPDGALRRATFCATSSSSRSSSSRVPVVVVVVVVVVVEFTLRAVDMLRREVESITRRSFGGNARAQYSQPGIG